MIKHSIQVALFGLFMLSGYAQGLSPTVTQQMEAVQAEKASRTPVERKLDSSLLYLSREATGKDAVEGAPDLESRVKCQEDGCVIVDIAATPSPGLAEEITAVGGTVIYESLRWKAVRASLPPRALLRFAARQDVIRITKGTQPVSHTGSVTSNGDVKHKAAVSRTDFGVDGTGINVGVISDSSDHSAASMASGDLPSDFTVLPGRSGMPGTGEGTAMSEIVHDLAPGAKIFFASANGGKQAFADAILELHAAGCHIIVDDISYHTEWQFQDDEIGQAINTVVEAGKLYLSSSGNEGSLKYDTSTTWEGDFVDGGAASVPLPLGGRVHSFGLLNYNKLLDSESDVTLQWSDEANSASNEYDLFILNAAGTSIVASSTDIEDGTEVAFESVEGVQPGERIVIWKKDSAAARYLRLSCTGSRIDFATTGQTIGHAATANCICVAASDVQVNPNDPFNSSTLVETSSSDGPRRMFYQPDGTPFTPGNFLAATNGGVNLQTPALTAADGGVTSFPAGGLNPFYGTSAAAPHAAALAALVWSKKPSLTNAEVRAILETSCIDIEGPGFDVNSGNGILMADLVLAKVLSPQEIWRHANFATYLPNGEAAPTADPDKDGLANLYEYGTGGNPKAFNASPEHASTAPSGETFTIDYRRNTAATDTSISFEMTTTLPANSWTPIVPASDTLVSTGDGVELRRAVFNVTAGVPREFFQVRVATN